jgi:tetratricopeptide (TPR) repeat protein
LAELIMRCLAKKAADRWQKADELRLQFEGLTTPSGGVTPTGTQPVAAVAQQVTARRAHPVRVATLFGIASAVTLVVVYALMIALGLPDWVFVGAIALLAVGLPIIMVTGHHERNRAAAVTTGLQVETPTGVRKHFTWRNAIAGGGLAFVGLAIVSTAYMAGRLLGIGPGATLMATGAIGEREPLVLAELDNRTTDPTLGSTVTELLRVSVSQSPVIRLVDPARLSESLGRMQRDPTTTVDESIALEIAEREGIKAVLSGDVVPLGSGYVVSARLVAADGTVLTAHQASANDAADLMGAIGELSAALRERVGESLRTIRRTVPLDLVTTGSLEALRLYTLAAQAEISGDEDRAVDLLEEAISGDSTFAMAYRKLGIILSNNFEQRARARQALTKAYEYRDRLTGIERGYTIAQYHTDVTGEREDALAAYRTILDRYPDDFRALNNSGVLYSQLNDFGRGLDYYVRALATDSTWAPGFTNIAFAQRALGRFDDAAETLDAMDVRFPGNPLGTDARGGLEYARQDYEAAERWWQTVRDGQSGSPFWQADAGQKLAWVAATRGRLREAGLNMREALAATEQRGLAAERLASLVGWAETQLRLTQNDALSRATLAGTPRDEALGELPLPDRPYELFVRYHVFAGDVARARQLLAEMESSGQPALGRGYERQYHRAAAWVALAEDDHERGVMEMRRGTEDAGCVTCRLASLAYAYDAGGNADSALAFWEQFAQSAWRIPFNDHVELPSAYRRIGELYEAAGNVEAAVEYYNRFVELWQDADPELQPQVQDVRSRIASLVGEGLVERE